jgi:hypothetical protein
MNNKLWFLPVGELGGPPQEGETILALFSYTLCAVWIGLLSPRSARFRGDYVGDEHV